MPSHNVLTLNAVFIRVNEWLGCPPYVLIGVRQWLPFEIEMLYEQIDCIPDCIATHIASQWRIIAEDVPFRN